MIWLLIIYLFSAGMFLVFYLLCCLMDRRFKEVHSDNIWLTTATPIWNTFTMFMCMGAFFILLYDKTKEIFKFLKEEIQLMKFSWKLKQELKNDKWFNQMKDSLKKHEKSNLN